MVFVFKTFKKLATMCDVVYSHTHAKRMCVYTRLSRGVQGMSIRILLACQWLFIDNSLNWVKQPSPRGSLTSSLRVHTLWFCASPVMTTYIPRVLCYAMFVWCLVLM